MKKLALVAKAIELDGTMFPGNCKIVSMRRLRIVCDGNVFEGTSRQFRRSLNIKLKERKDHGTPKQCDKVLDTTFLEDQQT